MLKDLKIILSSNTHDDQCPAHPKFGGGACYCIYGQVEAVVARLDKMVSALPVRATEYKTPIRGIDHVKHGENTDDDARILDANDYCIAERGCGCCGYDLSGEDAVAVAALCNVAREVLDSTGE